MGLKLGGFVCDCCHIFSRYSGVKSGFDLRNKLEKNLSNNISNLDKVVSLARNDNWVYYNVINLDDVWFIWKRNESKCFCFNCDRKLKLNKILNKYRNND